MGSGLFSPTHLVVLLLVALLLFGAKRLPEIGRSLGVGMREFKDSVTGIQDSTNVEAHSELPPPASAPAAPPPAPAAPESTAPAPAASDPDREAEHVS